MLTVASLPSDVSQCRCMQNVLTKWVDSDWVQEATRQAAAADSGSADVRCSWNQLATATGRLSSSSPNLQVGFNEIGTLMRDASVMNSGPETLCTGRRHQNKPTGWPLCRKLCSTCLWHRAQSWLTWHRAVSSCCCLVLQAVTKYTITAHRQVQPVRSAPTSGPCVLFISVRDAFVARPGMLLLSADYSQIELRLLAHFSGDPLLCQLLHQSGSQGDVFKLIAAAWMQPGARPGSGVSSNVADPKAGKQQGVWDCHSTLAAWVSWPSNPLPPLETSAVSSTASKVGPLTR